MPATALRCRNCETDHALEAVGVCSRCFGPARPGLRPRRGRTSPARRIEAGPPSIWRYADLLPVAPPAEQRLAPGLTPLVRRRRLADELGVGELWLKLDTANPTHSFKDRVVAVAAAKAQELGLTDARLLVDRQPRERGRRAGGRRGPRGGRLLPGRPRAREADSRPPSTARRSTRSPARTTTATGSRSSSRSSSTGAFVNVDLRSLLRRGLEDARVRDRRAARLAGARRGRLADRLRLALHEAPPGLRASCVELGLVDGPAPRLFGGQAEGCSPVATAFADGATVRPVRPATVARSLAIGSPADGDLAVATARATGGAIHAVAEDAVGENMALLAGTTGVFGETAPGVTLGALRAGGRAGRGRRATTASCCSSPATA